MAEKTAAVYFREIYEDCDGEDSIIFVVQDVVIGIPEECSVEVLASVLNQAGKYIDWWKSHRIRFKEDWNGYIDESADMWLVDHPPLHFVELLDDIRAEKRITLRLPSGLHTLLAHASDEAEQSLNTFCMEALAKTVGYKTFDEMMASEKD